ncbi:Holliday junction resolvase RuvX [Helicobacter canis]|uniref:Holliday junction resolvase RuvX n=1 Tax=Helicobacter canis TaxID=29419 RepID=UPI0026EECF89|nr:Holliday junction resolvase RuvX [Helicobacter canis]
MDSSSKILACDVGLKRIGLAHIVQGIILPLEPIIRRNRNQAAKELAELVAQMGVKRLVVGLPSGGLGGDTSTQKRIKHFVGLLGFGGEIVYVDEDFTSAHALESLSHAKRESKRAYKKNGMLDSLSACEILRRYLK